MQQASTSPSNLAEQGGGPGWVCSSQETGKQVQSCPLPTPNVPHPPTPHLSKLLLPQVNFRSRPRQAGRGEGKGV